MKNVKQNGVKPRYQLHTSGNGRNKTRELELPSQSYTGGTRTEDRAANEAMEIGFPTRDLSGPGEKSPKAALLPLVRWESTISPEAMS